MARIQCVLSHYCTSFHETIYIKALTRVKPKTPNCIVVRHPKQLYFLNPELAVLAETLSNVYQMFGNGVAVAASRLVLMGRGIGRAVQK